MSSSQGEVAAYWQALRVCQGRVLATPAQIIAAYRTKVCLALYSRGKAGDLARAALWKYHEKDIEYVGVSKQKRACGV